MALVPRHRVCPRRAVRNEAPGQRQITSGKGWSPARLVVQAPAESAGLGLYRRERLARRSLSREEQETEQARLRQKRVGDQCNKEAPRVRYPFAASFGTTSRTQRPAIVGPHRPAVDPGSAIDTVTNPRHASFLHG